jgi:dTDP-4-dehydrorhamnose 3,5-epimerase
LRAVEIVEGRLAGVKLIKPRVFGDARGFFLESFRADLFADLAEGITFVQDNHSRSRYGIVRGMHFQPAQWKLVRCARGAIFDVVADIRRDSATFGHWEAHQLDDESHSQLLVPDGFAHGFVVLSEVADVTYKVSSYYDASSEGGFRFDDPAVGIEWPIPPDQLVASARDMAAPTLAEIKASLSSGHMA